MGADRAGMVMLADGCGQFALAMGVELDLTDKAMGIRSRRYSMIVDDLKVRTTLWTLRLTDCLLLTLIAECNRYSCIFRAASGSFRTVIPPCLWTACCIPTFNIRTVNFTQLP